MYLGPGSFEIFTTFTEHKEKAGQISDTVCEGILFGSSVLRDHIQILKKSNVTTLKV